MEKIEIFTKVMEQLNQGKDIEDEVLFFLVDSISERFVESRGDSEWQGYNRLLDRLNKVWQYKQFEELSSEQSYLYGAIWGCLSLLSSIHKKKETSQTCYALAMKYETESSYTFLDYIYNRPGLQNKKLAELCGVSTARISQIASEASKDGLISAQMLGKEKSYFIRMIGESVHDIIQRKKSELKESARIFDSKAIFFSNKEDNIMINYEKMGCVLSNLNEQYNIMVGVVIGNKQEEIPSGEVYALKVERKKLLWKQEMSNSYKSVMNFWEVQKEVGMINQS